MRFKCGGGDSSIVGIISLFLHCCCCFAFAVSVFMHFCIMFAY